jgi:isopenicillin N synthase-like dioxygenase
MEITLNPEQVLIKRISQKLPSVQDRLEGLKGNKDKLHMVLHSGYRKKLTIPGAKNELETKLGFPLDSDPIQMQAALEKKNIKPLQRIDRLVKPDPRIYNFQNQKVSFDDLRVLTRSPIETEIQKQIQAIDLHSNPQQLMHDLETYGFAVLDTNGEEKADIKKVFEQAEHYLKNTALAKKVNLSANDASVDAQYRRASISGDKTYRPIESMAFQRPYFLDEKYDDAWKAADAQTLKTSFQEMANLLETKSQEVLTHLGNLFKLEPGSFAQLGKETDQSTLRLIHCISETEQKHNPNAYFDINSKTKTTREGEANGCVGIHTDWGLITLLPTATAQGLEFWYDDKAGQGANSGWVQLKSKPGELIVMPGNVAEILSGGKLRSVPHRVISKGDRFSMAYFTEVSKDTNIDHHKQKLIESGAIDSGAESLFEKEVRPYLTHPDQPLTGENYLLYMNYRNTRDLEPAKIQYAHDKGLFLIRS